MPPITFETIYEKIEALGNKLVRLETLLESWAVAEVGRRKDCEAQMSLTQKVLDEYELRLRSLERYRWMTVGALGLLGFIVTGGGVSILLAVFGK